MTEKNIRIAIIDDNPEWTTTAADECRALGLVVHAVAATFSAAEALIPTLAADNVSFVLLDNSVSSRDDGEKLAQMIKTQAPEIQTIGFSTADQSYVNHPMGKYDFSRAALRKIIFGS